MLFLWLVLASSTRTTQEPGDESVFSSFNAPKEEIANWEVKSNNVLTPTKSGVKISIDFEGDELWLIGKLTSEESSIIISIDEMIFDRIKQYQESSILYHTNLTIGHHKLEITADSKYVELHGIYHSIGYKFISKDEFKQNRLCKLKNIGDSNLIYTYEFEGNQIWITGKPELTDKKLDIMIDDEKCYLDLNGKIPGKNQILFTMQLNPGVHTVKFNNFEIIKGLYLKSSDSNIGNARSIYKTSKLLDDYRNYTFIPYNDPKIEYVGGTSVWGENSGDGRFTSNYEGTMRYNFTASRIVIMGYVNGWSGSMRVYIDGALITTISNYNSSVNSRNEFRFQSDYLDYTEHEIKIVNVHVDGRYSLGFHAFYVLNNSGAGIVEVSNPTISINKGSKAIVGLIRKGGSIGTIIVTVKTVSNTALQNINYIDCPETNITFEAGETTKTFEINTVYNISDTTGNVNFNFTIIWASAAFGVGDSSVSTITLTDGERPASCYVFALYKHLNIIREGDWGTEPEGIFTGNRINRGDYLSFWFIGCKVTFIGYKNSWSNRLNISIDGGAPVAIMLNQSTTSKNEVLYETDTLSMTNHSVKLVVDRAAVGFRGIRYFDNGAGSVSLANKALSTNKGSKINVTLNRHGKTTGNLTIELGTVSNTALDGQHFFGVRKQNITFLDGESTKRFEIQTNYVLEDHTNDVDFNFTLFSSPTAYGVGADSVCTITLVDAGRPTNGYAYLSYPSFGFSGTGWNEEDDHSGEYTGNRGDTADVSFTGNKFLIIGYKMTWAGTVKVILDGVQIATIDNRVPVDEVPDKPQKNMLLYESEYFEHGEHELVLEVAEHKSFGLNGIYVLNDNGAGVPMMNETLYKVEKGDAVTVNIKRFGGSTGVLSFSVETKDDTATSGEHYTGISKAVEFADGATSVDVMINTTDYKLATKKNVSFSLNIVNASGLAGVGSPNSTIIEVLDLPDPPGLVFVLPADLTKDGRWTEEEDMIWCSGGTQSVKYEFTGTKVWVQGYKSADSGFISIELDDLIVGEVDLHQDGEKVKSILYITEDLEYRSHTIKISRSARSASSDKRVMIAGLTFLDNRGIGSIEFAASNADVTRGSEVTLNLTRVGGSRRSLSIFVETVNGTASSGVDFVEYSSQINFLNGELFKTITIRTLFPVFKPNMEFSVRIKNSTINGGVFYMNSTIISINDRNYSGLVFTNYTDIQKTGAWVADGDGTYCSSVGCTIEYSFLGTEAWILGYLSSWSGRFNVFLDNQLIGEIDTNNGNGTQTRNTIIYDTGILDEGNHNIRIESTTAKSVGVNGIYYLDNAQQGSIKVSNITLSADKSRSVVLYLERVGGIKGILNATLSTKDLVEGSDKYYSISPDFVEFSEGETHKTVTITTKYFDTHDPPKDFIFNLFLEESNVIGGIFFINSTDVTIKDVDAECAGYVFIPYENLTKTGSWTDEPERNGSYTNGDGTYSMTFIGTNCYVSGYKSSWSGVMTVFLDGDNVVDINTNNGGGQSIFEKLYESPTLAYGNHTLKIQRKSGGSVGINGFAYLDNLNRGAYVIENKQHFVNKGQTISLSVERKYNQDKESSVMIKTIDGSAKSGEHYVGTIKNLTFSIGETVKNISIATISYESKQPTNYFFECEIYEPTNNVEIIGFLSKSHVVVKDVFTPPNGLQYISYSECSTSGTWNDEPQFGSSWTKENGSWKEFRFYGSKAWLFGTLDGNHGTMNVFVDGNFSETIDTRRNYRKPNSTLYVSEDLDQGLHTIRFECSPGGDNNAIGITGLYYLSNEEHGLFELTSSVYEVNKGNTFNIEIVRLGGSNESVTVEVSFKNGTAYSGIDFIGSSQNITFDENEFSKNVTLSIIKYRKEALTNTTFGFELISCTNSGVLGFLTKTVINIIDEEIPYENLKFVSYKESNLSNGWQTAGNEAITHTDGASMIFSFLGTKIWIVGSKDSNLGAIHVNIDGKDIGKVSTSGNIGSNVILFVSDDLVDGFHKLRIEYLRADNPDSHPVHINGINHLDNGGRGCINIAHKEYSVTKGEKVSVSLERTGGSKGNASVVFKTRDQTAVGGINYVTLEETVTFEAGVSEKNVEISTILFQSTSVKNLTFEIVVESIEGRGVVGLYYSSHVTIIDFFTPQNDLQFINYSELTQNGNWNEDTKGIWTQNNGDSLENTFTGSKIWIIGSVGPDGGTMSVTIDGKLVGKVSTFSETVIDKTVIYTSPDMKSNFYKLNIEKTAESIKEGKKLKVSGIFVLSNDERGLIEFKDAQISAKPGKQVTVSLQRVGGMNGEATVEVIAKDGTAVAGKHFSPIGTRVLTFKDKQATQSFTIEIIDQPEEKNLFFTCHLQNPTSAVIGFNTLTNITIEYDHVPIISQATSIPTEKAPSKTGMTPAPTESLKIMTSFLSGKMTEPVSVPMPVTDDAGQGGSGGKGSSKAGMIAGVIIALFVVIAVITIIFILMRARKIKEEDEIDDSRRNYDSEMETTDYFSATDEIGPEDDPLWGRTAENPAWGSLDEISAIENDFANYEESYFY